MNDHFLEGPDHRPHRSVKYDDDTRTDTERTALLLAEEAGIGQSSTVLEIGGRCESLLLHLARGFGCGGESVHTDEDYVRFAERALGHRRERFRVGFRHAPHERLPHGRGGFTHVVSADGLDAAGDRDRALSEIHRVLSPGGVFACTGFLRPRRAPGGEDGRPGPGREHPLAECRASLENAGFTSVRARRLDDRLRDSYRRHAEAARARAERTSDEAVRTAMLQRATECAALQDTIDRGELGWAVFVCRKEGAT